jgi:hypothetical protein
MGELRIEGHPAVHEEGLAVDVVRIVGGQPHGGLPRARAAPAPIPELAPVASAF